MISEEESRVTLVGYCTYEFAHALSNYLNTKMEYFNWNIKFLVERYDRDCRQSQACRKITLSKKHYDLLDLAPTELDYKFVMNLVDAFREGWTARRGNYA